MDRWVSWGNGGRSWGDGSRGWFHGSRSWGNRSRGWNNWSHSGWLFILLLVFLLVLGRLLSLLGTLSVTLLQASGYKIFLDARFRIGVGTAFDIRLGALLLSNRGIIRCK